MAETSEWFNRSESVGMLLISMLAVFSRSFTGGLMESSKCLDFDDLVPNRKVNQVAIRIQLEFPHDVSAMRLNSLHADLERCGYFFIASSLCQ